MFTLASLSKLAKSLFNMRMRSSAETFDENSVNPTISANRILKDENKNYKI